MTTALEDFMEVFTPDEQAEAAARTADLVERKFRRRVVRVEDLTEDELARIAKSEVPAEYAHLDDVLKDWRPEVA